MKKHPEQLPGEVFLGNARLQDLLKSSWKTSRLGTTPFFSDGTPFDFPTDLRPWFIQKSEVQAAIENEKQNPTYFSSERIAIFEALLS